MKRAIPLLALAAAVLAVATIPVWMGAYLRHRDDGASLTVTPGTIPACPKDVRLQAGRGGGDPPGEDGNVIFQFPDGTEALRVGGDGQFYVRGKPALRDEEAAVELIDWFRRAKAEQVP